MRRAAKKVFKNLTVEEDERLTPNGMTTSTGVPVSSLAALVWAMEETEGGNQEQRRKWWAFRSRRRFPAGPEEFVVGAVMAIPTPGTHWVPIQIEDSGTETEEELPDLGEGTSQMVEEKGEGKKTKEKNLAPRRSPRFLRCSPRLQEAAKFAAEG